MDGYAPENRREHPRERIEIEVRISNDSLKVTGTIFDLSIGGMSVLTPVVLPSNTEVSVSFDLAGAKTLQSAARIMWSSESRRAGLRFVAMGEAERKALTQWLSDQNVPAKRVV